MGKIFTGGISELAEEDKPEVVESQYSFEREPDEWTEDLDFKAKQFELQESLESAQTSGSVTPNLTSGSFLGPVIRNRDGDVTPDTLFTDAGTIDVEKGVNCFSMFSWKR